MKFSSTQIIAGVIALWASAGSALPAPILNEDIMMRSLSSEGIQARSKIDIRDLAADTTELNARDLSSIDLTPRKGGGIISSHRGKITSQGVSNTLDLVDQGASVLGHLKSAWKGNSGSG